MIMCLMLGLVLLVVLVRLLLLVSISSIFLLLVYRTVSGLSSRLITISILIGLIVIMMIQNSGLLLVVLLMLISPHLLTRPLLLLILVLHRLSLGLIRRVDSMIVESSSIDIFGGSCQIMSVGSY